MSARVGSCYTTIKTARGELVRGAAATGDEVADIGWSAGSRTSSLRRPERRRPMLLSLWT